MSREIYSLDNEGLTENVNRAIETFSKNLLKDDLIDEETFKILSNHRIIVGKKNLFGKMIDALKSKDTEARFFTVKIIDEDIK